MFVRFNIFYCVLSADSGIGGKAETHGVILRLRFVMVNGKAELISFVFKVVVWYGPVSVTFAK